MPTVQKNQENIIKIDKMEKKLVFHKKSIIKFKTKIRNKKKKTNDCMIGGVIDDFILNLKSKNNS